MSKYFRCSTNKNPLTYTCGEKIIFTISAKDNCVDTPCEYLHWQLRGDDGKFSEGLGSSKPGTPLILEASLKVFLNCLSERPYINLTFCFSLSCTL